MPEDAEQILLALADPIRWDTQLDGGRSNWIGKTQHARYGIIAPKLLDDVDATIYNGAWQVNIIVPHDSALFYKDAAVSGICVSTAEAGKAICVQHALTGNPEQARKIHAAAFIEGKKFIRAKILAQEQIDVVARTVSPPVLGWPADDPAVRAFAARGIRSIYTVRFEPEKRWIVTLDEDKPDIPSRCFLTRTIARAACNLYDHTGNWYGSL